MNAPLRRQSRPVWPSPDEVRELAARSDPSASAASAAWRAVQECITRFDAWHLLATDDPAADPIGSVRQGTDGRAWIRRPESPDDRYPWIVADYQLGRVAARTDAEVTGWPVLGAVPGTPAASV